MDKPKKSLLHNALHLQNTELQSGDADSQAPGGERKVILKVKVSHEETGERYEADALAVTKQADAPQSKLQNCQASAV